MPSVTLLPFASCFEKNSLRERQGGGGGGGGGGSATETDRKTETDRRRQRQSEKEKDSERECWADLARRGVKTADGVGGGGVGRGESPGRTLQLACGSAINMLAYLKDGSARKISCTCCHTEIEVADQTCNFIHSQYPDTIQSLPAQTL